MDDHVCFLVSVLYEAIGVICKIAIKVNRDKLPGDCESCPLEPENRQFLHSLLPQHVRELGPVVDVEEIFEVATMNRQ